MIPYSRQTIDSSDIREINKVLKSDLITQGPKVVAFENEIANDMNIKGGKSELMDSIVLDD